MREELEICINELFEEIRENEEREVLGKNDTKGDFMKEVDTICTTNAITDCDNADIKENVQAVIDKVDKAKDSNNAQNVHTIAKQVCSIANNQQQALDLEEECTKSLSTKEEIENQKKDLLFEYDTIFDYAHAHVAKVEGKLSDHKNDPGGITKYGISLNFLEDYAMTKNGRAVLTKLKIFNVSRKSIIEMTSEQSKNIMYNAFWIATQISKLPPLLAIIAYDFAVNSGSYYSSRLIQRAIGAKVDGIIGQETITKANALNMAEQKKVAKCMLEERVKFYQNLARSKPKMAVFLKGWLSRVETLRVYLNSISKKLIQD